MTPFDYAVLAVVIVYVLVSLFRGAVREVMSIVSWIAAFMPCTLECLLGVFQEQTLSAQQSA